MGSTTFRRCSIADLESAPNFADLIHEYGAESSIPGIGKPAPRMDIYHRMDATGMLHTIGVFDGEMLAGFAVAVSTVLPHYGVQIATCESLFVGQAWRKQGAGTELLRAVEKLAQESGAVGLLLIAPLGGKLARVLDADDAYSETNRVFFRGFA